MSIIDLKYFDLGGVTNYRYHEKVTFLKRHRMYTATGAVPAEIAVQGADAVKSYVDEQIKQIVGAKKEHDRIFDENRRALNVPISCDYQSTLLEGRIICRDDDLVVDLESPVQGSDPLAWGNSFGGAMAGHEVWAEPGVRLTEEAIARGKRHLVEIYKRESSLVKELVKKLNKKK